MFTLGQLKQLFPYCPERTIKICCHVFENVLPRYEFTSINRVAYFIGQTAHESGEYKWMRELWTHHNLSSYQKRYERNFDAAWPPTKYDRRNRKAYELGNSERGDGYRFRGWGPMQNTGRACTLAASKFIYNDDRLLAIPGLLDNIEVGFFGAIWFWIEGSYARLSKGARNYLNSKYGELDSLNLHFLADNADLEGLTYAINGHASEGPPSHMSKRRTYTENVIHVMTGNPIQTCNVP